MPAPSLTASVPVLDLTLLDLEATRPQFISSLKHALLDIGFLYLTGYEKYVLRELLTRLEQETRVFFALPEEEKLKCEMTKNPHFLGYTRLANEITAQHIDWREQIDLGTELPPPEFALEEDRAANLYRNLVGPNMWPDPLLAPTFRPVIEEYLDRMRLFLRLFVTLVCEAIGLAPTALNRFFSANQQTKMKLILYPDVQQLVDTPAVRPAEGTSDTSISDRSLAQQGCGPHRDLDLLTYIFQVTNHVLLQVQNFAGEWVDVPPVPNTLVVNAGQLLEALTHGVCVATIHRVLTPPPGLGTRILIPVFQTIDIEGKMEQVEMPALVLREKAAKDKLRVQPRIGFQYIPDKSHPVGWYVFRNRIKSHQDVAKVWYPRLLAEVLAEVSGQ